MWVAGMGSDLVNMNLYWWDRLWSGDWWSFEGGKLGCGDFAAMKMVLEIKTGNSVQLWSALRFDDADSGPGRVDVGVGGALSEVLVMRLVMDSDVGLI